MPAAIWNEFRKRFDVELLEFYGAAEGGLTANPPGVGPVGSIGKPIPTLVHRIVDEYGNDVPRDANGERTGELLFMHKDGTPSRSSTTAIPRPARRSVPAAGCTWATWCARTRTAGCTSCTARQRHPPQREFINAAFIEKVIAEVPEVDDVYVYGVTSANGVPARRT